MQFSFDGLLEAHGITVRVEPGVGHPDMPNRPEGATDWTVVVSDGSATETFPVSVLSTPGRVPTSEEALGFVVADVTHPMLDADDHDWLAHHGVVTDTARWLRARDAILAMASRLENVLPARLVEALGSPVPDEVTALAPGGP